MIQAITLLVIAALVAIDQVIKIAVVNRFAAGGSMDILLTKKIKPGFIYWCVAVVIAGGAGNFVDRVARGFVVDYIEPTFVNFAVFNFADCCVTVGAALLIIKTVYDLIRENKKYLSDDDKKAENGGDEKNV